VLRKAAQNWFLSEVTVLEELRMMGAHRNIIEYYGVIVEGDRMVGLVLVALRVPAHAPWLARRSLVHRVTRMTCHAPVRTGGDVGAGWDLD